MKERYDRAYREPAPDVPGGFRVAYRFRWAPAAPLMSAEEFNARFDRLDHYRGQVDAEEPDDGGLFHNTIGRLLR